MVKKKLLATILVSTLATHATTSEAFCDNTAQTNYSSKLQFLLPKLFRNDTKDACEKTLKYTNERRKVDEIYQTSSLTDKRFRSLSRAVLSESSYDSLANSKNTQFEFKTFSPKQTQVELFPKLKGYRTISK